MNFEKFILQLESALKAPLPGKQAQIKMSPVPIDMRRFEIDLPENHRKSGVLILFYPESESAFFPLIKRPEYAGFHSGQVAFPGGKMEISDANIIETALREAEEEVGIDRSQVQIMGCLSELFIPTSNFLVTPVIGFLEKRPDLVPEEKEVSRIIQAELSQLLRPEIRKQKILDLGQNLKLDTPYFEIDGEVVWGATAMILSELIHLLHSAGR
ncbi:MAG: CoA pyrophosphatase [Algoriphagus sp.]|jgi:8-oxo-dGTP pyrophosphatase MutT (NUDIX family)|uniref:NUDIX hydrolase n=1 Tax=Algoriphagus sp. TaxID=1872435 RepID=UPI0027319FD5|nr:CoA pyrophosphatase [Algoriphagus sp.]MDP2040534.1 CoA pyrophosphatase [Algoriphagus sp.]MDP3470728.1 CoA pyrophosphatase [Algoriphagus sp.]